MEKELRIYYKNGEWHCELWSEFEEPFHSGKQYENKFKEKYFGDLVESIKMRGLLKLLKSEPQPFKDVLRELTDPNSITNKK
jgi:hypothetical protein